METLVLGQVTSDAHERDEDRGGGSCIGQRTVVHAGFNAEAVRQAHQSAPLASRQQQAREMGRVYPLGREVNPFAPQAAEVKIDVLADNWIAPRKRQQPLAGVGDTRRRADRGVRHARQRLDKVGDLPAGVYQRLERLDYIPVRAKAQRPDLRDAVALLVQAGGFEVKGDKGIDHGENIRAGLRSLSARPAGGYPRRLVSGVAAHLFGQSRRMLSQRASRAGIARNEWATGPARLRRIRALRLASLC